MGQEAINLTTVVSGFDSGTNLDPVGVRQNNQGVTLAEANAFIAVDAAAPSGAAGVVGDFSFNDSDNKIYVCVAITGTVKVGRVIPGLTAPSAVSGTFPFTVTGITPTGGSGTGLAVTLIFSNATTLTSATVTTVGLGYKVDDVVTVTAGTTGAGSGAFNLLLNAQAVAAEYKSVALT
tara:strand:+ start:328 stop:861 length:534 start_codon:yes stop_codon:yes gene_type:complete